MQSKNNFVKISDKIVTFLRYKRAFSNKRVKFEVRSHERKYGAVKYPVEPVVK